VWGGSPPTGWNISGRQSIALAQCKGGAYSTEAGGSMLGGIILMSPTMSRPMTYAVSSTRSLNTLCGQFAVV